MSTGERKFPPNRRLIVVNCRKPRTEVPVAENNPQINCQSTQLQVYGKVLFKTVQEKAVKEIYNLFSWAYISLYF